MRVLLIEDDAKLSETIRRVLEQENHKIALASTGPDGLAFGVTGEFDVIILDVMLPGLDGNSVCRSMRAAGVQTPVLMLTALADVDRRVEGLESGADDYLPKPFAFKELLARLNALHRRSSVTGEDNDMMVVEDLELNLRSHRASRSGQNIELTATEFKLLEYLMRNSGQVMTRGKLLDAVWGLDYDGESNVVDTYIHYLRRKIDGISPALIQTIRGVGYSIRREP